MFPEVILTILSKLGYFTYLGDVNTPYLYIYSHIVVILIHGHELNHLVTLHFSNEEYLDVPLEVRIKRLGSVGCFTPINIPFICR